MKNIIILLAIFLWTNFIYAQPYVNWLNYSFSQRVTDIDINGNYLWICTHGGMVRYNKKTGEKSFYNRANSNLPENYIVGGSCVENGDIWVSSRRYGIGKLNNLSCTIYNQSNSGLPFDQLNSKVKLDKQGNVWIASFRWMTKFNGKEWKTWKTGSDFSAWPLVSYFDITDNGIVWLYSTDGIGKIKNDEYEIVSTVGSGLIAKAGYVKIGNKGSVWVAIENEGIYKYDGSSFTNYTTNNSCLPTNLIYAIDFDSENNMWLATDEGLISFDTETCEVYQPEKDEKPILTLRCDENNVIWCGTLNGKLLKFNGSFFSTIELSNSPLKSNNASPLFTDKENHVWIRTTENIVKKTSTGLSSIYEKSGYAAIQNEYGEIWLSFNEGDTCLLKITDNKNEIFDSLNSPFNSNSNAIASFLALDNIGNLWISTRYYGLFKYDGTEFINFTTDNSDIPSNEVKELAFDKNNNLWGGSANGLFKFDGTNWTVWDTLNSSIPTNLVTRLIIDPENNIWFTCMDKDRILGKTWGGGLIVFNGQKMKNYSINNSGLLSNTIGGILNDGDKLWLATYGAGLMCFDKKDKWEVYDVTNSGIANNKVQGLIKDKNGNIWMGHNDAGISVFNPDSAIQTSGLGKERFSNDINSKLLIYPNPVKDELFVNLDLTVGKIAEARIYDLNGRLMQIIPKEHFETNGSSYNFKIQPDLSNNQMFMLSLKMKNGNVFNGRFIISR